MTGPDLLDAIEELLKALRASEVPQSWNVSWAFGQLPIDAMDLLRALLRTDESKTWRCFYCDEVFTTETEAAQHFGGREGLPGWDVAACVDPLRSDEKARMAELHEARVHALRKQHEAEDREELARQLDDMRSEIGRLFGECGGVTASSPHEAYLVLDRERGRVAALEEQLAEAQSNARTDEETAALRAAIEEAAQEDELSSLLAEGQMSAEPYERVRAAQRKRAAAVRAIPAARREQIRKDGQGG